MKKKYIKPQTDSVLLNCRLSLLQPSRLGGNNPFNWGDPDGDR